MNWKAGSYCLHLYCALTDTKPHFQAELQFVSFQKRSTIISKPPLQIFSLSCTSYYDKLGSVFSLFVVLTIWLWEQMGVRRAWVGQFLACFCISFHYWTVLVILKVVGLLHCWGAEKTIDGGDTLDIWYQCNVEFRAHICLVSAFSNCTVLEGKFIEHCDEPASENIFFLFVKFLTHDFNSCAGKNEGGGEPAERER